jgi:hypothetical protein
MTATSPSWSSTYSGWYDRTTPLPSSTPVSGPNLLFAVTYSAMGGNGLNVALFKPDIAVTSTGQIRKVQADDFDGLSKLAKEITTLERPESSKDSGSHTVRRFRIYHKMTCRPFTILNVLKLPEADNPVFDETSVYGFSKATKGLEGGGDLPSVLWELLGLMSEAPSPWGDAKVDEDVLKRLKEISTELGR